MSSCSRYRSSTEEFWGQLLGQLPICAGIDEDLSACRVNVLTILEDERSLPHQLPVQCVATGGVSPGDWRCSNTPGQATGMPWSRTVGP
jgi:hypothetical protein